MLNQLPPIYFYLPQVDWRDDLPKRANTFWSCYGRGQYSWTLQTYLQLKADGFPCQLVPQIPDTGIVLAHRDSLPYNLQPKPQLLLVCLKADQNSHPYAQIHVVQNYQETQAKPIFMQSVSDDRYLLPGLRFYIPHWSQPGLIPRSFERGDKFENVVYFGLTNNIAPEIRGQAWQQQVNALGLYWTIEKKRWYDYSNVDAVVAVRSFSHRSNFSWKPATKLYNAWHAGVPAILGRESAFQRERMSNLDYIEVNSPNEVISALKRLRDDVPFRQAMIENGKIRAKETEPQNLVKYWRNFLTNVCTPYYYEWCESSQWKRQYFFSKRYLALKVIARQRQFLDFMSHFKK